MTTFVLIPRPRHPPRKAPIFESVIMKGGGTEETRSRVLEIQ